MNCRVIVYTQDGYVFSLVGDSGPISEKRNWFLTH